MLRVGDDVRRPPDRLSGGTVDWHRKRVIELADRMLARCRGEGPANCEARCPLRVDAHLYVQLAKAGRFREALQTIR